MNAHADLPIQCMRSDVKSISLPVYPDRPSSARFTYRYQLIGSDTTKPVVIFMPGGPGVTSITNTPDSPYAVLPKSLPNIVYTDQRTSGCNSADENTFPADSIKLDDYAEDIVALIKALQAQGFKSYVLYGHSFGTAHLTTVVAHLNDHRKNGDMIALPSTVVLEGTMGHFYRQGEALAAYQQQWRRVWNRLDSKAQGLLSAGHLPFELPAENWGYFVMMQFYTGRLPSWMGPDLAADLNRLSSDPSDSVLQSLIANSPWQGFGSSFVEITCHELMADFFATPSILGSQFIGNGNLCAGKQVTRKYDSATVDFKMPVIYFQGTNDAATPVEQARYHFNHRSSEKRTFITVNEAGHEPLQISLWTCKSQIWSDIVTNGDVSDDTIQKCKWDYGIDVD